MMQLHKACSLDPTTVMGMKFLPTQDSKAESCCCIVRYVDQESAGKAVEAIKGRPVQLRSGTCKFFGAKIAKPAKWMIQRGVPALEEGEERPREPPAQRPQEAQRGKGGGGAAGGELDWCGQGTRCVGRVGMLLYEDTSTGTPFCEACWDHWQLEQEEALADGAPGEGGYELGDASGGE